MAERVRGWLFDIALVLVVLFGVQWWRGRELVDVGAEPPPLALATLDGDRVDLEALAGRPVMIHFWATWCSVCRREFGAMNAVAASAPPDAVVLSVVEDSDDLDYLAGFVAERGIAYPVLLAAPETIGAWRISVFPTTYYIDANGLVSGRQTGMATRWGMRARLWLAGLRG